MSIYLPATIRFRYYSLYRRLEDGRISYFRGTKRNGLYIQNLDHGKYGDFTWEENYARLFGFEPKLTLKVISKNLPNRPNILQQLSYQGFTGIVEVTHLILPRG